MPKMMPDVVPVGSNLFITRKKKVISGHAETGRALMME